MAREWDASGGNEQERLGLRERRKLISFVMVTSRVLVLALVTAAVAGSDLLELEILETEALIAGLKQKTDLLLDLKALMTSEGREIPVKFISGSGEGGGIQRDGAS